MKKVNSSGRRASLHNPFEVILNLNKENLRQMKKLEPNDPRKSMAENFKLHRNSINGTLLPGIQVFI